MRFSLWPMGMPEWEELLSLCQYAEATGWDGVWYADHFMPNQADVSAPTAEVWTTVSALAARVPRLRIGTLVCGNTYRHPAVLAKMAAQADIISGGRIVLGLGAGWQENEHRAYGIPFYTTGERLRRLDEACQIVTGLFSNPRTSFAGRYYEVSEAPLEPKPLQHPLPLLIGGGGEKVTLRIAAKYANEWNTWGTPEVLRRKGEILAGHCNSVGRDPSSIRHSAQALFFLDEDTEAIEAARAARRFPVIAGNSEQLAEVVQQYADAGVTELVIPDRGLGTGAHKRERMDQFMREVAPAFR